MQHRGRGVPCMPDTRYGIGQHTGYRYGIRHDAGYEVPHPSYPSDHVVDPFPRTYPEKAHHGLVHFLEAYQQEDPYDVEPEHHAAKPRQGHAYEPDGGQVEENGEPYVASASHGSDYGHARVGL